MEDWRIQRDQALLLLENAKRPDDRSAAADRLMDLAAVNHHRWPELEPIIPGLIADRQEHVRRRGVSLAALMLPPDRSEPILTRLLSDPFSMVRMEAAGQLADLALPSTRAALALALQDATFAVRFEAARGMAALKHSAGLEVLVEGLGKNELRFRAIGALAELGDPRALPALRTLFGRWLLPAFERTQTAGALVRLGDGSAVGYLLKRTQKRWSPDRPMAVELLGEVKVPGAFERLCGILADPKDACRGAAARGLGRLGDARAQGALVAVVEERGAAQDLRLDAAEGLCLLGSPEALRRATDALPTFEAPEARAELEEMLKGYAALSGERT